MESPQEFMKRFLREAEQTRRAHNAHREPFQSKFYAPDLLSHHLRCQDILPEAILEVFDVEDSAQVITSGRMNMRGLESLRTRYQLQPSGDSWLIRDIEMECIACKTTGKAGVAELSGEPVEPLRGSLSHITDGTGAVACPFCKGGWKSFLRTA